MVHKIKLFYKCLSKDILKTLTAAWQADGPMAQRRGCHSWAVSCSNLRHLGPKPRHSTSPHPAQMRPEPTLGCHPLLGLTIGRVPSILCWVTGDDVFMIWLCLLAGKVADKIVYGHYIPTYICSSIYRHGWSYVRSYKGASFCRVNYVQNVKQKRLK